MKNISFYIIGLLFLFLPQFIHAQTTDTDVNSFLDKAEKELYTNPQQAAYYATKARAMATSSSQQSQALYIYAQAEKLLGDFDGCIQALYEADALVSKNENDLKGHIYNLMSVGYCNLGDYTKAINLSDKAISAYVFRSVEQPKTTRNTQA